MNEIIKLNIKKQCIQIDRKVLVKGTVNVYECEFTFDEEWNELAKVAVFVNEEISKQVILEDNKCLLPWETLSHTGHLYVGVYGLKDDMRYPTIYTEPTCIVDGCDEGEQPVPPTPQIWEQIIASLAQEVNTREQQYEELSGNITDIFQQLDKKMEFYEVTLIGNEIYKGDELQTYQMLKEVFDSPKYWLYLKTSGVCFLPLGKLNADQERVIQFSTQYDFDDGIRYERIEITENNVVTTLFKHFEITENKASSITGRIKTSETKYPSVKATVDYIETQKAEYYSKNQINEMLENVLLIDKGV